MKIKLLGCGASTGVPVVGCDCIVCRSDNPKNKRLRTSAIVSHGNINILIDSGIDYREQMLKYGFVDFDGILYTHTHQDHTHGIEDMRISAKFGSKSFSIFATEPVMNELQTRFPSSFAHNAYYHKNCVLQSNIIKDYDEFIVGGMKVESLLQVHGHGRSTGYIFNDKLAYCTDVSEFPTRSLQLLKSKKLNVLILVCVRWGQSHAHFNFDGAQKIIAEIGPKRVIFTHMNHEIDYDEMLAACSKNVEPGFDMMEVDCD